MTKRRRRAVSRENGLGQPADFVKRRVFRAELDEVRTAVAELLGDGLRGPPAGNRVHEGIKQALG